MAEKNVKKAKNIRFPNDLLQQAEDICAQRGCSFSTFVKQAVEAALADLQNQKDAIP